MKMREYVLLAAFLIGAMLWAACGAEQPLQPAPEDTASEEVVQVENLPAPEFLVVQDTDEFFPQTDEDITYRDFSPWKEPPAIVMGRVTEFTDMPDGKDIITLDFGTKEIICRMTQRSVVRAPRIGTTVTIVGTCSIFYRDSLTMKDCRLW